MKKASGIVLFERDSKVVSIKGVYFLHSAGRVNFKCIAGNKYSSVSQAYNAVLSLAKNNGFRIPYCEEFGRRGYDIMWVDCNAATVDWYYI